MEAEDLRPLNSCPYLKLVAVRENLIISLAVKAFDFIGKIVVLNVLILRSRYMQEVGSQ
jgi:hypothetical protein